MEEYLKFAPFEKFGRSLKKVWLLKIPQMNKLDSFSDSVYDNG